VLILGGWALVLAITFPISMRRWERTDRAERERVAGVLRQLAAELGGRFIEPRVVRGVEDGDEYAQLDHGTASVTSEGLAVEVGVQVIGTTNGQCLKVFIPAPPGRTWAVAWLDARVYRGLRRWSRGAPGKLSTFRSAYRSADPEQLSLDARVALLDLLRHATDVSLDAAGLTMWTLPARWPPSPRVRSVTDVAALLPHVHRTAAAARLLLTS
jgi:hypothetical protein